MLMSLEGVQSCIKCWGLAIVTTFCHIVLILSVRFQWWRKLGEPPNKVSDWTGASGSKAGLSIGWEVAGKLLTDELLPSKPPEVCCKSRSLLWWWTELFELEWLWPSAVPSSSSLLLRQLLLEPRATNWCCSLLNTTPSTCSLGVIISSLSVPKSLSDGPSKWDTWGWESLVLGVDGKELEREWLGEDVVSVSMSELNEEDFSLPTRGGFWRWVVKRWVSWLLRVSWLDGWMKIGRKLCTLNFTVKVMKVYLV